MKLIAILVPFALLGAVIAWHPSVPVAAKDTVAYPEGYRSWVHVKSAAIGPSNKSFSTMGGFQHIYANSQAMVGYRTRVFPEGSVIVFDWLGMTENAGAYTEGARLQLDVMVRDSVRFAKSGGWGFQRFVQDSKTELAATPTPQQCAACHEKLSRDGMVLSSFRQ